MFDWHSPRDLSARMIRRQDVHVKRWWQAYLPVLAVTLLLATGCSRQPGVTAADRAPGSAQQLPFDRASDSQGVSPTGGLASAGIPAGTPITIRLRSPLSSADSSAGEHFDGMLQESLIVGAQTVAPRGASVSGRVVAASPGHEHDPGYLRLTLSGIVINGKTLPLQTSSIFVKGRLSNGKPTETSYLGEEDVRFSTDRRLTFRVTQSVSLQD